MKIRGSHSLMNLIDYKVRLSVARVGYGHWQITYHCGNGCSYTGVTDNSSLIDAFDDSDNCTLAVCKEMARIARKGHKL